MRVFTKYLAVRQPAREFSLRRLGFPLRVPEFSLRGLRSSLQELRFGIRTRWFVLLTMVLMSSACGNKGDLFLDGRQLLVDTTPAIEDALDELEVLEAEEGVTASKVLEDGLLDEDALPNGKKLKE